MSPPDLHSLLANARDLTTRYKAGKLPESFQAFRELIQLLLGNSILSPHAFVCLAKGPRQGAFIVGGYNSKPKVDPLPLTDGRYLNLVYRLVLHQTKDGPRVKVESSVFQYQMDKDTDRWIFRYDYVREPPEPHPSAHVHIRGNLAEPCLQDKQSLDDVHFPTNRVSLESVIRLLIEQFNVPPNNPSSIWRPLLAQTEALFLDIAHKSLSGPQS